MSIGLMLAPAIGSARAQARMKLMTRHLGDAIGEDVHLEVASSYKEIASAARRAAVELVWAPPAVCAELVGDCRAIYKCIRNGTSVYRSALLVRAGEEREGLATLRGKRAAWVDRLSFGGHLLAVAHLAGEGLDPEQLFAEQRFVGSYPEAIRQVVHGRADVAAVTTLDERPSSVASAIAGYGGPIYADRLAAIAVTDPTPNDALIFTHKLKPERFEWLRERLFGTLRVPHTPTALCMALDAEGFEPAFSHEYDRVARILARFR